MKSPPGRKFFFIFIVMAVVMAIGFVGLSIPIAQATDLGLVGAANATTINNTTVSAAAVTAGGSVFRGASMATANITVAEPILNIYTILPIATATKARGSTATFTADSKTNKYNNYVLISQGIVIGNDPELIQRC